MSSEIFGLPRSAALRYREFALGAEGVPSASLSRKRGRLRLKCDGTHAETRFRLSPKRTSPFKSAGASVQSTAGSRGVRISSSSVRVLATHSIRQFPLYFPSRASPCAITFQLDSTFCQYTVFVTLFISLRNENKVRGLKYLVAFYTVHPIHSTASM